MPTQSLLDRLRSELASIQDAVLDLVAEVPIVYRDWGRGGSILYLAPDWLWGEHGENTSQKRIIVHRLWEAWKPHFQLLIVNLPSAESKPAKTTVSFLDKIVALSEYPPGSTQQQVSNRIEGEVKKLMELLERLAQVSKPGIIVAPDTNSLIANPELADYSVFGGGVPVTVALLPTVLGELDELKVVHRSEDFRKKVESIIRRLKEMRRRGDVVEGVNGGSRVTVRFIAKEPRFDQTLSWLDPSNNDDRIIASALELQRENYSAIVILVTGDMNHQNKAAAALLPYEEPPNRTGAS